MNIRRALIVAIVGALIWEFARAESTVVDTQLARGDFHSVLDAVKTAGTHFLEPSRRSDWEYVGGILKRADGTYRYTAGHGQSRVDTVSFRIKVGPGDQLVAFWHTHGRRGALRELFSAKDGEMVSEQGLPLYLIGPSGRIRVLEPGRIRPARVAHRSALARAWAAEGMIVGRIP